MAPSAVGGIGCELISEARWIAPEPTIQVIEDNVYISGKLKS